MGFYSSIKVCSMTYNKAASTPFEPPKLKDNSSSDAAVNVHYYRSMIGSLMYLTASRPDIMFAVSACARNQFLLTYANSSCCKTYLSISRLFLRLKRMHKMWFLLHLTISAETQSFVLMFLVSADFVLFLLMFLLIHL
ncbi:hypothetical protein Tco_0987508 [Tanacetum coccineum]